MIKAEILLDSLNPVGDRLTTWLVTIPRWILAELNTHRMFSRNASSSRAIPVQKMIDSVMTNPAIPVFWGKNQPGMVAHEELDDVKLEHFRSVLQDGVRKLVPMTARQAALHDWLDARDNAVASVKKLLDLGLHKQNANRLLEPWMHVTDLVSATNFENFFALRAHFDAQPEFRALAYHMLDLYQRNSPRRLREGEWHIPFGDKMPKDADIDTQLKISAARCARLSYNSFDGDMDINKDFAIVNKLSKDGHWSPFEHQAQALGTSTQSGNFVGWKQYRKTFPNECRGDGRVPNFRSVK